MNPLVSILLPTYNMGHTIAHAIASVCVQDEGRWELIIVDDGSDDDTSARVAPFVVDERIQYITQSNQGVSAARNRALRASKGEWILLLDADDALTPWAISERMKLYHAQPHVNCIDGRVALYDETLSHYLRSVSTDYEGPPFRHLLRLSNRCFTYPSWMIQRTLIAEHTFPEHMTHAEDLYFYLKVAASPRAYYASVPHLVLRHRQHTQSAMHNLDGLAAGYRSLYAHVVKGFGARISMGEKLYLWWRIQRIMSASFLRAGKPAAALQFAWEHARI